MERPDTIPITLSPAPTVATIDPHVLAQLRSFAKESDEPLARLTMDEIAAGLGISRMSLYRRAGSRRNIIEVLEHQGIWVQSESAVRERVITATAELARERPIADITLEDVARRARCSLSTIQDHFESRLDVFEAMFERYSPLARLRSEIAAIARDPNPNLDRDTRLLYGMLFDAMREKWPLLRAFVAETIRDPDGEVGKRFREWYAPRIMGSILPILTRHVERESLRPLPTPFVASAFIGPLLLHMATRDSVSRMLGANLPDREQTIDAFTSMFIRAVRPDGDRTGETASEADGRRLPDRKGTRS